MASWALQGKHASLECSSLLLYNIVISDSTRHSFNTGSAFSVQRWSGVWVKGG